MQPLPANQTRQIAWGSLKGRWGTAIVVVLVATLLGGTSNGFTSSVSTNMANNSDSSFWSYMPSEVYYVFAGILAATVLVATIYGIVTLVLGGAVQQGLCQFNIDLIQGQRPAQFNTLFSKFSNFGKCFLLNLITSLIVTLGTILLVIPGIIAAYGLAMAPYIMAQNPSIGVMEAVKASWELMRGKKWNLFCLQISYFGWYLLTVVTCGIAGLWVSPYAAAGEAAFYLTITGQLPGMQAAPGGYPPQDGYAPPPPSYPQQNYTQPTPPQDYTQPAPPPPVDSTPPPPPPGTYPPDGGNA